MAASAVVAVPLSRRSREQGVGRTPSRCGCLWRWLPGRACRGGLHISGVWVGRWWVNG